MACREVNAQKIEIFYEKNGKNQPLTRLFLKIQVDQLFPRERLFARRGFFWSFVIRFALPVYARIVGNHREGKAHDQQSDNERMRNEVIDKFIHISLCRSKRERNFVSKMNQNPA